jgi:hypothetical protein
LYLCANVIKYKTNDGNFYEINSNYFTNWGVIQEGDSLNIAYKKNNPEDAKYLEGGSSLLQCIMATCFSVLVFIGLSFVASQGFVKKVKEDLSTD